MLLKHRIVSFPQIKEEMKSLPEEDAWLNDVGPLPQSKTSTESETKELSSIAEEKASAIEQESPVSQANDPLIGLAHRLWPLVREMSERIGQELHSQPAISSVYGALLNKLVQKRAIDILREDPKLAQQVCDVAEARLLLLSIENEVLGYGPLEALLKDESVSEIMVVGPHVAYVERNGVLEDVASYFEDDRHMTRIIENMLRQAGRHIQPDWPIIDMRLPDGTLVNVVMPPSAVNGPTITIRKGSRKSFTIDELVQMETLNHNMAKFLSACIEAHLNIVICGGIGSGRTTLLNALGACIPEEERVATIEEIAELRLNQKHVISLVPQPIGPGGKGTITIRDLVVNALHIGSERILLDECRDHEGLEMIQAMNNGYSGFLMNLYAHDLRHCLARLEMMCLAGGGALPLSIIRTQIASALHVIIHISRLRDGSHKILNIAEVQRVENDVIKLQSIFHFKDAAFDAPTGMQKSSFEPSGFSPTFLPEFDALNIPLPSETFKLKDVQV